MGCGCGGGANVTQGPRSQGVTVDDGTFAAHGSGEDVINNTPPVSRASGFIASAAGTSLPARASSPLAEITTAVVVMPIAPVPPVTIRQEKPSHERMFDVAREINAEKHARSIALVQLQRTRNAMCFTCPALSTDRKTCLLAANHLPPVDAIDVGPLASGERRAFVASNTVAWRSEHGGCPLDRFPREGDDDEVVIWEPWWMPRGMLGGWYGVPEPLRWLITLRRWRGDTLNKCGCSVLLKRLAKRRGFGWVGTLAEGVQLLRKDMTKAKVFSAGPSRVRRRAIRYVKWRIRVAIAGRLPWLAKRSPTRTSPPATR